MNKSKLIFSLFALTICLIQEVSGQDLPPLQADRPDQTETPVTVPKKFFQAEFGLNAEKVSDDEFNYLYPTILWKYGLTGFMELRLVTELRTSSYKDVISNGFNPVNAGFKINFIHEHGLIPMTSVLGYITIPALGSRPFRTTYPAPGFKFAMQHTLSDVFSLSYNVGAEWDGETGKPYFLYSLSTGISLSDKTGAYIELYGFTHQKGHADLRADGGLTYYIKPNLLADLSGGFGITENAPDFYGSIGISFRLPR